MSTAFHPQTDGLTERVNSCMEQYLGAFVNHEHDDWVQWLPLAEFAANNGTSELTKCTLVFPGQGVDPQMMFAGEPTEAWDQRRLDMDQVQGMMEQIHKHLRVEMRWSQAVQEEGTNRGPVPAPNIQVESMVCLEAQNIQISRPTQKLDWKRLAPFTVVQRVSAYAYELELPMSTRIHWLQSNSLLDRVADDCLVGQRVGPPLPVMVDGEEEYQVSSVEDSRVYRSQLQYLIRWTDHDSLTWEPAKFVDGLQAVGEFHQSYPGKPGPLVDVLGGPRT